MAIDRHERWLARRAREQAEGKAWSAEMLRCAKDTRRFTLEIRNALLWFIAALAAVTAGFAGWLLFGE